MQKLLPAIRSIAGDVFVFQQDSAPAHRARDRVELLRRQTSVLTCGQHRRINHWATWAMPPFAGINFLKFNVSKIDIRSGFVSL